MTSLAVLRGDCRERLFGDGEHAARAAGAVVEQVRAGLDLVLDRQEHEVRHQPDGVARRPVLAGLLVVLLVELADQFLEDRAHRVVVDAGCRMDPSLSRRDRGEVDLRIEELVDQRAERIGLGERGS